MTRSFWTAAAAAVIAFGIGETMSAHADSSQTELAVLQQIETNTAATNAQLTLLNQQISKLAATAAATAQMQNSIPNQQTNMSRATH